MGEDAVVSSSKEVVLGFGLAAELGNPSGSSFIEDGIQSRHCSGEILSAPR
jgi:hypothetical protein